MIKRQLVLSLAIVVSVTAAPRAEAQSPAAADTAHWLADFEQLKREMTSHYANLEWAVERRGVNLPDLASQTATALRNAASDAEARRALDRFVAAFGDGHLYINWPAAPRTATTQAPSQPPGQAGVCARNGYRAQRRDGGIAFRLVPGFRGIASPDSAYFPAGVLTEGTRRVGILRISSFEDNIFPALCEEAAGRLRVAADSSCDDRCSDALEQETGNAMGRALSRQIALLEKERVELLVVDITANGGGTNWVEVAARSLSARPLQAPRRALIRHPHHVRQLESAINGLVADSARVRGTGARVVQQALATLRAQEAAARIPCDRSMLWSGGTPACSLVVSEPTTFATGVLRYAAPGSVPVQSECCSLYNPSRYTFQEGAYRGPLAVLVDNNTASAAEYFAATLADNRAATVLGMPTNGSGCGYTNGGIPVTLDFSGARVKMPDCVRFRADGTNEVEGVTPHVIVPWRPNDSALQRARRAVEAIARLDAPSR